MPTKRSIQLCSAALVAVVLHARAQPPTVQEIIDTVAATCDRIDSYEADAEIRVLTS